MADTQAVIVNEILCFISNNLHSNAFDDVVKCCAAFYSGKEIVSAKDVLFDCAKHPTKRKIVRKTASVPKEVADTSDIVQLLLDCDAENITLPTFAAVNLSNLPSLPVSDADIKGVYKELTTIKQDIAHLSDMLKVRPTYATAARRGQSASTSGLLSSAASLDPVKTVNLDGGLSNLKSSVFHINGDSTSPPRAATSADGQNFTKIKRSANRRTAGVVGSATDVCATGLTNKVLKASPRRRCFYVGRFDVEATASDIQDYLSANRPTITVTSVVQLPNTEEFGYAAFKVTCSELDDDSQVLDSSLWPIGVRCRVFFEGRKQR